MRDCPIGHSKYIYKRFVPYSCLFLNRNNIYMIIINRNIEQKNKIKIKDLHTEQSSKSSKEYSQIKAEGVKMTIQPRPKQQHPPLTNNNNSRDADTPTNVNNNDADDSRFYNI